MRKLAMTSITVAVLGTFVGCGGGQAPKGVKTISVAAVGTETRLDPKGIDALRPGASSVHLPQGVHVPGSGATTTSTATNTSGTGFTGGGSTTGTTFSTAPTFEYFDLVSGQSATRTREPVIASITPSRGGAGTLVTLQGSGFVSSGVTGMTLVRPSGLTPVAGAYPQGVALTSLQVTDSEISGVIAGSPAAGSVQVVLEYNDGWSIPNGVDFDIP